MNKMTGMIDTIEEFAEEVVKNIKGYLPEEYRDAECEIANTLKNNGVYMTGILIHREGDKCSPKIYLESFFQDYRRDRTFGEVMKGIACEATNLPPFADKDINITGDFESVRHRLAPILVNAKANRHLLKDIPHLKVEDLALFCRINIPVRGGVGGINVTESFLEKWGIGKEQLFKQMFENTKEPGRWVLKELQACMGEIAGIGKEPLNLLEEVADDFFENPNKKACFMEDPQMYVLTNKSMVNGAAAFVCPGVMEKIGRLFPEGMYILPSSIHEVLVIGKDQWTNPGQLKEMVREVNRTQVEATEVLSNNVYEYDRERGKIRLAVDSLEKEKGMER